MQLKVSIKAGPAKRVSGAWRAVVLAGAGAVALAPATIQAQGGPRGAQQRMVLQALDTNHDGKLSPDEIAAAPVSLLKLDRNGDGQLTADELQPPPEHAGANPDELVKQLMAFDRNGDGVLTREELPERMRPMFDRGDANHDGKLTAEEIRAMAARQAMPMGAASGRNANIMRMDPLLYALDTNHDGVISAVEIAAASRSLLTLDKNGDGELTADEMRMREQSPEERVDHLLGEWDTNKDGRISKAEAPNRMQQQFDTIDKNHDGFLDRSELLEYFRTSGGSAGGPRGGERNGERNGDAPKETKQP